MLWSISWCLSWCLGLHGSIICSSLVRRAFLHQSILFSFVSPLPAGSFSINLDYHPLILMDNNVLVCGRVVFFELLLGSSWWIITSLSAVVLFWLHSISCLLYLVVYNTARIRTRCYQSNAACTRYWLPLILRDLCQGEVFLSPDISTTSSLRFQVGVFVN